LNGLVAGGVIGSIVPGIGTAIGILVGGMGGGWLAAKRIDAGGRWPKIQDGASHIAGVISRYLAADPKRSVKIRVREYGEVKSVEMTGLTIEQIRAALDGCQDILVEKSMSS